MYDPARMATRSWWYLAPCLVAAILVASHTPVGAALSMDSLSYLSTANNILDGNGIVHNTFALSGPAVEATTVWPPLYAVLLAPITWLASLAGTSDIFGIAVFNVLALVVSMYLVLRIASLTSSIWAGVFVAIAIAISPSLQIVFTYAWSEVVFIPLSLAAYLCLQRYLMDDGGDGRRGLYAVVLLLGLATYTRYVGLAFFSAAALALLLYGRGSPTERLRTVALATLAYLAILAPLLLRNLVLSGSLSGGDRGMPDTSLPADVATLMWYLYLEFLNLPVVAVTVLAIVTVVTIAWLLFRQSNASARARSSSYSTIVVPFLFAFSYMIFLLLSRSRQTIDLDTRMLSVAVPFLLIGLLGVYQQLSMRTRSGLALLPFLLPACAFAINAINTHASILKGWHEVGEPGSVLGLTYRSMTGRQLDSLRDIKEHFAPNAGDLVLTDISRPIIVGYLFPSSDVRQIPNEANELNFAALDTLLHRQGIAIIGSTAWSQTLARSLEGRASFYKIEGRTGGPEFIVIKLPVDAL